MKTTCEGCSRYLQTDGEAFICSYECTFCPDCAFRQQSICPHCGGELVRRPRRAISTPSAEENETEIPSANGPGLIWAASFGVWTFVSLAATATIYQLYRRTGSGMRLGTIAGMEFSQILAYAPLTPFVFSFALRYPVQRRNWARRSPYFESRARVRKLLPRHREGPL